MSIDSHVQSGSLFPFDRSNSLVSILFVVQEVGNGTDAENGRKDASSKSTARGCCRTQYGKSDWTDWTELTFPETSLVFFSPLG